MTSSTQNRVAQLRAEVEAATAVKADREAIKREAEVPEAKALEQYKEAEDTKQDDEKAAKAEANESEAREVFDSLDLDSDGQVSQGELQQDVSFDTNRDGHVSGDEAAVSGAGSAAAVSDARVKQ